MQGEACFRERETVSAKRVFSMKMGVRDEDDLVSALNRVSSRCIEKGLGKRTA